MILGNDFILMFYGHSRDLLSLEALVSIQLFQRCYVEINPLERSVILVARLLLDQGSTPGKVAFGAETTLRRSINHNFIPRNFGSAQRRT